LWGSKKAISLWKGSTLTLGKKKKNPKFIGQAGGGAFIWRERGGGCLGSWKGKLKILVQVWIEGKTGEREKKDLKILGKGGVLREGGDKNNATRKGGEGKIYSVGVS